MLNFANRENEEATLYAQIDYLEAQHLKSAILLSEIAYCEALVQ